MATKDLDTCLVKSMRKSKGTASLQSHRFNQATPTSPTRKVASARYEEAGVAVPRPLNPGTEPAQSQGVLRWAWRGHPQPSSILGGLHSHPDASSRLPLPRDNQMFPGGERDPGQETPAWKLKLNSPDSNTKEAKLASLLTFQRILC